jgi:hypothetical protein
MLRWARIGRRRTTEVDRRTEHCRFLKRNQSSSRINTLKHIDRVCDARLGPWTSCSPNWIARKLSNCGDYGAALTSRRFKLTGQVGMQGA